MKRIITTFTAILLVLQGAFAQTTLPQLTPLKNMKDALHPSSKNGKWGYANDRNKFIIKPVFDGAEHFFRVGASDGSVLDVAKVKVGPYWGYVSREGIWFIEPKYESITDFDFHSVAFALSGGSYIMYGVEPHFSVNLGEKVVKAVILDKGFDEIPQFPFRGITIARKGGKYGILKSTGEWLVPCDNDSITEDSAFKMYKLARGGLIGYSTYSGEIVFPVEYKSLSWFSRGVVLANNGKVGLLKADGSTLIPVEYDSIEQFESHLILRKDGKAGLANLSGRMIIPVEYDAIEQMSNGNFMVKGADGYNVYGPDCTPLFPISFDSLTLDPKLGYIVVKDGRYGRLDSHGKYLYPPMFESVPDPAQKGYIEMMVDGVPYIFLAGESAPRKVSDYDDMLYRQMSDRSYAASTILPAWLKGHMGRGRIENLVLLKEQENWLDFDSEESFNRILLKCGKTLGEVMPYGDEDYGFSVYDAGERVIMIQGEWEMFATAYVYDVSSGKRFSVSLGDGEKSYALDYGIIYEAPGFYNLNPGMSSVQLICYTFHSWAGEKEAAVCPNSGEEYTVVEPDSRVNLELSEEFPKIDPWLYDMMGKDLYIQEHKSGSFVTYEMLVHSPAENGIALYEIVSTCHYWKYSHGVVKETKKDAPVTVAYGYIGLGCEYFVQPLFLEASGFEGDTAKVRIADEWLSLTKEQIAAYDPFIQPL